MFDSVRSVGVLVCLICTILFFIGGMTENWVIADNGHFGLWEYCDNSVKNVTHNNTSTNRSLPTSTTSGSVSVKEKAEKDDDEDNCSPFGIASIPALFHIVRIIIILAGMVLAWGVLSGKTIRIKVVKESSFVTTHLAELLGLVACVTAYFGLVLFRDSFKYIKDDIFIGSSLGWSYNIVRISTILYFPGVVFMLAPSIQEQYSKGCRTFCPRTCSNPLEGLCIVLGLCDQPEPNTGRRVSSIHHTARRHSHPLTNSSETTTHTDNEIVLRISETDFRSDNDVDTSNPSIVPGSDLPQYEDLPASDPVLPPPPSYDEVIAGNYLSFASTPPSYNPNSDSSSSLPANPPPPPMYDSVA